MADAETHVRRCAVLCRAVLCCMQSYKETKKDSYDQYDQPKKHYEEEEHDEVNGRTDGPYANMPCHEPYAQAAPD